MRIMKKRILRIALALVMTLGIVAGATTTMSKDVDAACGHWAYYTVTEKEATCSDYGIERLVCYYCGQTLCRRTTPTNGVHNWQRVTTVSPASCTRTGVDFCRCARCGTTAHLTTPATGHSYYTWYEGVRLRAVCIFCGDDHSYPEEPGYC